MTRKGAQPLLLLVDDEPSNLALLERLFGPHYRVIAVSSGQEALDLLAQAPFDLVLLDVMMPRMSGLDVLKQMRGNPATADLPVILISALADRPDVVRGLRMGANDYITKPIETDVLNARVQTHLKLKQLQDTHKETIAELQAAQELRDLFFRIASHDLKSPLTNIGMIQSLLEDAVGENDAARGLLDLLGITVEKMQNVVTEFLDMAALEAGAFTVQPVEVDVAQIVQGVVEQHHLAAQKKQITLEVHHPTGVIYADPARTGQALDNLVSNAIKYSPPRTTVIIWTETRGEAQRIAVRDHGPGIPAEERERLFTPFGKLSPRPTSGEHSTGLGLWITKHMITLQGGEVGMDPAPGGGCIFWIELPLARAHQPVTP